MQLIPIKEKLEENEEFLLDPSCLETLQMTINFYKRTGFVLPWIGYFAKENDEWVGSGGFKGQPVDGTIEIAYGVFEKCRQQGIGAAICKHLVDLSLKTDPSVRVTARTLPEENFSTKILKKNNFILIGSVNDSEDGEVWEWLFQ